MKRIKPPQKISVITITCEEDDWFCMYHWDNMYQTLYQPKDKQLLILLLVLLPITVAPLVALLVLLLVLLVDFLVVLLVLLLVLFLVTQLLVVL